MKNVRNNIPRISLASGKLYLVQQPNKGRLLGQGNEAGMLREDTEEGRAKIKFRLDG